MSKKYRSMVALVMLAFSLILFFENCVKEEYDMNKMTTAPLTPEFGAPVVFSELSLEDMINDFVDSLAYLRINNDKSISLIYKQDILSQAASELFSVPDQSFTSAEEFMVVGTFAPGDSQAVVYPSKFDFNLGYGEILDSMRIKSGMLNATLTGNINYDAKIRVTTNYVLVNGAPLEIILNYDYQGSLPVTVSKEVDLTNAKVIFKNTGSDTNVVDVLFFVTAYGSDDVPVNPYSFEFTTEFQDIQYKSVYGYFGQFDFAGNAGTVSLDLFKNEIAGGLQLDEPVFTMIVKNTMGLPIRLTFDKLKVYSKTNSELDEDITGFPNPWDINYPVVPGQSDSSLFALHKDNSNLVSILQEAPEYISYDASGLSNPNGRVGQNFILDDSKIEVKADVEIPLAGRVEGIELKDTVEFSLQDMVQDFDMIEYISILLKADNYFPVDAVLQIYLMDSLNTWPPIDSMFSYNEKFLLSAVPGPAPDYKVTAATTSFKKVVFDQAKSKKLENVKSLIIKGVLSTYNQGNSTVKIYTDHKLGIKIGVQAKLNLDL